MKQIAILEPYKIGIIDVPKPKPEPDQILTKTTVCGVSIGTELIDYRGGFEKLPQKWKEIHPYTFPVFPGYENVGKVVEVGKNVKDVEVGDRVVHCGTYAEYCCVPRREALPVYAKIPDSVSDEDATLAVLGTTTMWAVIRGNVSYGDNAVVLGDGVVGILTAQHAKLAGADKVILVGNHPGKLKIARQVGVEVTINHRDKDWREQVMQETDGLGGDIVLECVGSVFETTGSIAEACEVARERGSVVIVGDHMAPQTDLIFVSDPHFKELSFYVVRAMGHGSTWPVVLDALNEAQKYNFVKWTTSTLFKRALKMIAQGKLKVHPLITHRFKYTDVVEAFRRIDAKKEDFLQILLTDW